MSAELGRIGRSIHDAFRRKRRLLSFAEYFELLCQQPTLQARNTAQYLLDMFEHFGRVELSKPQGPETRYRLFDGLRTDDPEHVERLRAGARLVGQERVQEEIASILTAFVRERRVNRLVLLHGPNGSAKSTIIRCILRAMRAYSRCDEGALYRFRWVFPRRATGRKGIGFGGGGVSSGGGDAATYAYLPDEEVDARLPCEISDHPIFFVPGPERRRLLRRLLADAADGFVPSDYILHGDLCHKCRQIYEALLQAYHGDYAAVLRHVQVERFFVDPRYRSAAVTVEPQLRVDAGLQQQSMDSSLSALPASLKHLSLFAPFGDLVDGNRGVIEYNDMLKRSLEAWKYILSTCENSTVSLDNTILFLDAAFLGSSNDVQLDAFKASPDWAAFKGRIELVRTPYLLNYLEEEEIYADALEAGVHAGHVAPHTERIAAIWAVLTRLRRPTGEDLPEDVAAVAQKLTPLQKAELYATGAPPDTFSEEDNKLLRTSVSLLWRDGARNHPYEGRVGASPREVKMVLLQAGQTPEHPCVGPLAVLRELEGLVQDATLYAFLQIKPEGEYLDPRGAIGVVRGHHLDLALGELQQASGLVAPQQHAELFDRYVLHVTHWIRREQIRNAVTRAYEDPSAELMSEVEGHLGVQGDPRGFREGLMSRIGAWRVDHPTDAIDYAVLFPAYLRRIRDDYFEQHRQRLRGALQDFVTVYGEPDGAVGQIGDAERQARAESMHATLTRTLGYCTHCAVDTAVVVLHERLGA